MKATPRTDKLEKELCELKERFAALCISVCDLEKQVALPDIDSYRQDGDYSGSAKQKIKILEERVDDLEQSDFKNTIDKLTKKDDNVVVKVTINGQPVVDFVKGKGSKVPYTFIRRARGTICGNCAWESGNVCILGLKPVFLQGKHDTANCSKYESRKYYI